MHVQNFYFANMNLLLFCRFRCRRRRRRRRRFPSSLLLWSKHFADIITWRHKARAHNKIPSVHPPPSPGHTTYTNRKLSNRGIYGGTTQPLNSK